MPAEDPFRYDVDYPKLLPCSAPAPSLPPQWSATAVLHPFAPPPPDDPCPPVPFFQLCTATLACRAGAYLSVQITGCEYGTWWYVVRPTGTVVSADRGETWERVDLGWTLPTTDWFGDAAPACAGTSPVNWLQPRPAEWWRTPVRGSRAATWYWLDAATRLPCRIMAGEPPPTPARGDPARPALFQMYSLTWFASFGAHGPAEPPEAWAPADIPGFAPGNAGGHELVVWHHNFAMTTLMTPVDAASAPLPTRVLYRWAPDEDYRCATDRAQSTLMWHDGNPADDLVSRTALLFGLAPPAVEPPRYSGRGFLVDRHEDGSLRCETMPLGAQSPAWCRVPAVRGRIRACLTGNPVLAPGTVVVVISVVFPPTSAYPQGRYLWTWYSPFPGSDGSSARPVTFMESGATVEEGGTRLALADYFDYRELAEPLAPRCFAVPAVCAEAPGSPGPGQPAPHPVAAQIHASRHSAPGGTVT